MIQKPYNQRGVIACFILYDGQIFLNNKEKNIDIHVYRD